MSEFLNNEHRESDLEKPQEVPEHIKKAIEKWEAELKMAAREKRQPNFSLRFPMDAYNASIGRENIEDKTVITETNEQTPSEPAEKASEKQRKLYEKNAKKFGWKK